ncbi:ArsR/SmtB family transcription factor [Methanosarcina horonobensis]|uniref:ArsR/SmtB family transcription factor n=1 Tax=Methanosarcina horonobensis TaxID=418008 RepID=UPI0022B920B8|nr:winged helix-turn-helix domain-containing protein [Methanosarcina horonobensis]
MNITEDLVLVPVPSLPDEVSLLARALSRPLPMQILNQLRKKQMSAGELASELGLRLNTLAYNLCLLEKVGLIKVRQVKWSCKGREVKIYALTEQPILLVPLENRDNGSFVLDVPENCSKNLSGQAVALLESSEEKK